MRISYQAYPAKSGSNASGASSIIYRGATSAVPLVSAVMVTRGNADLVRSSLACFRSQVWPNRELIVVCDAITPQLRDLLSEENEKLHEAPPDLPLGGLRNMAVSLSSGDFICQWDDDDLYDPNRISIAMQILLSSGVSAVFLSQWLIWWQDRDLLALSGHRIWEGSMVARRETVPVYPAVKRAEDSVVADFITKHCSYALIDAPALYCYRITGQNTWDQSHFEALISRSPRRFDPKQMNAILDRFSFALA